MKVAFLTSGGIAPCLSSSIGRLSENYLNNYPDAEIIGYLNGYKGLLMGNSISFPKSLVNNTDKFHLIVYLKDSYLNVFVSTTHQKVSSHSSVQIY